MLLGDAVMQASNTSAWCDLTPPNEIKEEGLESPGTKDCPVWQPALSLPTPSTQP